MSSTTIYPSALGAGKAETDRSRIQAAIDAGYDEIIMDYRVDDDQGAEVPWYTDADNSTAQENPTLYSYAKSATLMASINYLFFDSLTIGYLDYKNIYVSP